MKTTEKTVYVLYNLGGPERNEDVRPFLVSLLSDPEVIPFPRPILPLFAHLVTGLRIKKVRQKYADLGGGSPLPAIMRRQASLLQESLEKKGELGPVMIAMRYGEPSLQTVVKQVKAQDAKAKFVFVSLFPHESLATTGTAVSAIAQTCSDFGMPYAVRPVYYAHPLFIAAWVEQIEATVRSHGAEKVHLLFSAHNIPMSLVKKGDPYPDQVRRSVALIVEELQKKMGSFTWSLGFQSRVGPMRWMDPDTVGEAQRLLQSTDATLFVVPISFTCDNLETLHELGIELPELCPREVRHRLVRVPCPNESQIFVDLLRDICVSSEFGGQP